MKLPVKWMIVPAMALGLGACGEKEKAKPTPETPAPASPAQANLTPAPNPVPAPAPAAAPTTRLSADERATKLGFAKYLPQDTEIVMSVHNGGKLVERVKSSKLGKFIKNQSGGMVPGLLPGMGGGMEDPMDEDFELPEGGDEGASLEPRALDPGKPVLISTGENAEEMDEDADEEMPGSPDPGALFGQEITVALGKSVGEQTANLVKLYSRMGYFQMRTLVKAFAAGVKEGDLSTVDDAITEQYGPETLKDLLNDSQSGMNLVEKLRMPPVYIALRAPEKDRAAADKQIGSMLAMALGADEAFEPVTIEKAGAKFQGLKVSGAKVSEKLAEDREGMEEMLDAATVDKLLAAVAKNDLVVASGILGDYLVLFIGASVDDLKIAETPGASLLGTDALAFCDSYASKDLVAVIHASKEAQQKMATAAGTLGNTASGIRDGLAASEGLGDTRDLQALLQLVADREGALLNLVKYDAGCTVAFLEDGLKIESIGGTDVGALDWDTPNRLTPLGESDDVAFFLNMTSDAKHDTAMRGYLESITETAYAMSRKLAGMNLENEELAQFNGMFKIFDEKFRADAIAMWDAVSGDFADGVGAETALVIDLKGSLPTIPGVSQKIVDEAKCPRIAMVCPVTDRTKIQSSWSKMNTSLTSILGKVGEMTGQEIPMQKPMSSERNGNTTWYFSMPFINDDFVPSVTVGDKWFSASTSKSQALDLIAQADKGGPTRTGMVLRVNFDAFRNYAKDTLKTLEKGSGELLGDAAPTENDMKKVDSLIDAMDEMEKLTFHARREGGAMRTSIHFKTR